VAIIQCFGAALNLNVHIHALVLDGVYGDVTGARGALAGLAGAPGRAGRPECSFVDWVRRLLTYLSERQATAHPRVQSDGVQDFLTHLATHRRVRQALRIRHWPRCSSSVARFWGSTRMVCPQPREPDVAVICLSS
jgi:hypothetical protein